MIGDWYDRQGRKLPNREHDLEGWLNAMRTTWGDPEYRRVDRTDVDPDTYVSTVWLGIDYNFGMAGPPMIFETMIFGGDHDGCQWRWPNEALAVAGHDQIVAHLRDKHTAKATP